MDTGELMWVTPDGYTNGSVLAVNDNGYLVQSAEPWFNPAAMEIGTDGYLTATE
jgi:hypothetical protein